MFKTNIQILFETLLFMLLFFNVFVLRTSNMFWVTVTLAGFIGLLILINKFSRPIKKRTNIHYYLIIGECLLTQGILYLTGFFTSFSSNYNVFYKNYLNKYHIICVFIIVLLTELARYLSLLNLEHSKKNIKYYITLFIGIINYILIDYIIMGERCNFAIKYEVVNLFLTFIIPTFLKHLLLDDISKKYGYVPNLWYRLIMDLYTYFIPIVPEVNVFIKTVILSLLPYLMYMTLENVLKRERKIARREKKKNKKVNIISLIILTVLVYLISCQFTYSMIAIGSESMQGTINKGDAIIYKKYKNEKLNTGDVIVFSQNNRIIIHRISKIIEMDNKKQSYITKGDANLTEDNWIVTPENIIGIAQCRIVLIAWPSVLLNEWL